MGLDMCFPLGWSFGLDLPDGKWQESSLGLGFSVESAWWLGSWPVSWVEFWLDSLSCVFQVVGFLA